MINFERPLDFFIRLGGSSTTVIWNILFHDQITVSTKYGKKNFQNERTFKHDL